MSDQRITLRDGFLFGLLKQQLRGLRQQNCEKVEVDIRECTAKFQH